MVQALEGRTLLSTTPIVSQTVDFSAGFPAKPATNLEVEWIGRNGRFAADDCRRASADD